MYKKGLLIVLSGPSGTGKGTVCRALMADLPDIHLSVSCTTRPPRTGEKEGVNYFFKNEEDFRALVGQGRLLEHAEVYGHYYGTPLEAVEQKLAHGVDVLLEIDVQGAMKVKQLHPQGVFIFLAPPSLAELEKRMRRRCTESEEQIQRRLDTVREELQMMPHYAYIVVNDVVKNVVKKIRCILCAEKLRTIRNTGLEKRLIGGDVVV